MRGLDEGVQSTGLSLDAAVLVHGWARRPAALPLEAWCAAFPFDAVSRHWHSVGRAQVGPSAIAAIDEAAVVLAADDTPARPPTWAWFLRAWLPMLVDIGHGRCTYATYVGTPALTQWTGAGSGAGRTGDDPTDSDTLVALLLAHLLRHECEAMGNPLFATKAVVQASRLGAMADALVRHRPGGGLIERGSSLADAVLDDAPASLVRQAGLLALPMTTVPEEHLFLRVLQLFETVFAAMLTEVEAARSLLDTDEVEGAAAALGKASARLGRAIPFFRILATMQPSQFALIREETPGASGLQSTSFKAIELACGRPAPERLSSPGYVEPVVAALVEAEGRRRTIEEHAVGHVAGASPAADRLVAAMASLEHRWGQWKKAHWATAARLIGDVPGTGGTAGAAYLRAHVDGPLFPSFWSGNPAL